MAGIFESKAPWELPVVGFAVQTVEFHGGLLTVVAYGAEGTHLRLMLSGPFDLRLGDSEHRLDTEDDWRHLVPMLDLRDDAITRATVTADSALRIEFASGQRIESAPDELSGYQNWEVNGPGFKIVGSPGEPSLWTGEAWEQPSPHAR